MSDGDAGRQLHAALTDVGRIRDHNEDALLALPEAGLYAVADGMGGHAAGDVASAIAIRILRERLGDESASGDELRERVATTLREAGRTIHHQGRERPEQEGMGTTASVLILRPGGALLIGHVGDSRIYRLRRGELTRMTRDHTIVQERVERGELTQEQARVHPASSVLTRALGVPEEVEPDMHAGEWEAGDLYLLCSDGLTAMLPDGDLGSLLRSDLREGPGEGTAGKDAQGSAAEGASAAALEALARALVDEANERGGQDNITVVLVRAGARPGADQP